MVAISSDLNIQFVLEKEKKYIAFYRMMFNI